MTKLYISTDLGVKSSGGDVTKKELEALRRLDNDVIVLDYNDIHPVAYGLPDIPFLIDYLTMEKLSKIDLANIDLAHMYGGSYTQTVRFLKSKGIKTTQSMEMHDRKISIEECEKLGIKFPFNYVSDDILWNMLIGTIREVDILMTAGSTPKQSILRELRNEYESKRCGRVEIMPHGCDVPDKKDIEPLPEQFNVGYLGAVGPDKGLIYLIQAWSMLNYNDSTLIFAGNQTEYLPIFIRQYANGGRYHVMGWVEKVSQLYNRCSIYVQPSATEGFGIEVPEAMGHERPVIVSNGAGAADCVTDYVDGFVVPKRDPKAIAEKIDWFKSHPKELREMGLRAREKSLSYSWERIQQRYINLWKSLLDK